MGFVKMIVKGVNLDECVIEIVIMFVQMVFVIDMREGVYKVCVLYYIMLCNVVLCYVMLNNVVFNGL